MKQFALAMMSVLKKHFQVSLHDYVIIHIRDSVTVQSLSLWHLETIYHASMGIPHQGFSDIGINLVLKTMPTQC